MSVILILIWASLTVALVFLGCFIWAVRSGQFDDTVTPSMRVLMDEPDVATHDLESNPRLPLTLSCRERGQPPDALGSSDARLAISDARTSNSRRTILPPAEEGRGESCEVNQTNDSPQRNQIQN
jgi:cbb3-type cytochrome oxidase maturation protein